MEINHFHYCPSGMKFLLVSNKEMEGVLEINSGNLSLQLHLYRSFINVNYYMNYYAELTGKSSLREGEACMALM